MIEKTILSGLIYNETYIRKVIPFLKDEYFDNLDEKLIFQNIKTYIDKYNGLPTKEALRIAVEENEKLNEDRYKSVNVVIDNLEYDTNTDIEWIVEKTEKFCQDKALYNAVRESILVLDSKNSELERGSIPELLTKALGVSFDSNIGHDFIEDAEDRFDFYHMKEEKVKFDLEMFNKITKGGLSKKSLSIALAGTGVGKSLFMCHCAASNMMSGLNVLYITMEMAEERIAERIDANLLDFTLDELRDIPREAYQKRLARVKSKTNGKLIVKEYPTASAGSGHFRHLLNELRLKKNFSPDVIYIDYLNICMSSRLKVGANVNSYTYIKAIAEELRGLAVEFNVPIMSATQTTRSGFGNSDVGLEDTSESFGLPATADFMFALISSEELEQLGQIMVKQLKNRWGSIDHYKRFTVGIDRSKMKLFDAEESAQDGIMDDRPVMGNTEFGGRQEEEEATVFRPRGRKPNFEGLN
jgi:archaellum biogenesis ATPase FlaH